MATVGLQLIHMYDIFKNLGISVDGFIRAIYIHANVEPADECLICGSDKTMRVGASFAPLLKVRMFENENFETNLIHCCNCGIFYVEMSILYSGYRDEKYQEQRQKYEPNYTKEFNARLSESISEANRKKVFLSLSLKKLI